LHLNFSINIETQSAIDIVDYFLFINEMEYVFIKQM